MIKKKLLLLLLFISCDFAAGSYPYVELYNLSTSEEKIIKAVNLLKHDYPNLTSNFVDKRSENGLWYYTWFYIEEQELFFFSWIRDNDIGLVSVCSKNQIGKWKDVNKDFAGEENKKIKKIFEEKIVNKIKKYLSNVQN